MITIVSSDDVDKFSCGGVIRLISALLTSHEQLAMDDWSNIYLLTVTRPRRVVFMVTTRDKSPQLRLHVGSSDQLYRQHQSLFLGNAEVLLEDVACAAQIHLVCVEYHWVLEGISASGRRGGVVEGLSQDPVYDLHCGLQVRLLSVQ